MEPIPATSEQSLLDDVRRRRAELLGSIRSVERSLAAPAPGRRAAWIERVRGALLELSADFAAHIEMTEGPDGLYREVLEASPRLADAVAHLTRAHVQIRGLIDDLLVYLDGPEESVDVQQVRELGTTVLAELVRHRQKGSDLVYEAYESDIGGET